MAVYDELANGRYDLVKIQVCEALWRLIERQGENGRIDVAEESGLEIGLLERMLSETEDYRPSLEEWLRLHGAFPEDIPWPDVDGYIHSKINALSHRLGYEGLDSDDGGGFSEPDNIKYYLLSSHRRYRDDIDRTDYIGELTALFDKLAVGLISESDFLRLQKHLVERHPADKRLPNQGAPPDGTTPADFDSPPAPHYVRVPVFDAQGGLTGAWTDGGYPVGEASAYETLPSNMVDENSFIVVVHGDSMAPGLPSGGKALVVPGKPLENGKRCFVSFPGEDGDRMVKRYYRYGDRILLRSDNPAFPDLELTEDNSHGVRIYRVTWTME